MRGKYVANITESLSLVGSPPLAREIRFSNGHRYEPLRITPACAGNTLCIVLLFYLPWDHPRLRGKYHTHAVRCLAAGGSPPLAREIQMTICQPRNGGRITPAYAGKTTQQHFKDECDRITPAYAGKTFHHETTHYKLRDHPRLRGKDLHFLNLSLRRMGSPPLTRERHIN